MEDRIHAAGKSPAFEAGMKAFEASAKTRDDEHELYDVLTGCGATSEEADEFINMITESGPGL